MLVYLNSVPDERGGWTTFPKLQIKMSPQVPTTSAIPRKPASTRLSPSLETDPHPKPSSQMLTHKPHPNRDPQPSTLSPPRAGQRRDRLQ